MADHLLEQTLQAQAELAAYYQRGVVPADPLQGVTVAEPPGLSRRETVLVPDPPIKSSCPEI